MFIGEMLFNVKLCGWLTEQLHALDIVIITKAIQNLFTYVHS